MASRVFPLHWFRSKRPLLRSGAPWRSAVSLAALAGFLMLPAECAPAQTITLGSTSGNAGWLVTFDATLDSQGSSVAATQNDIFLDARHVPIAANAQGDPDCTVNPATGKTGRFAFHPVGCTGSDCLQIRAVIHSLSNTSPIPNGILYTCRVQISPAAPPDTYPLYIGRVRAGNSVGTALSVTGSDGEVLVEPPCGPCGCP